MHESDSSLSPVCEPFFTELCLLCSEAPPPAASTAASRALSVLDVAVQKSSQNPGIEQAFKRIRSDLVFFADYMLSRRIPGWRSLAEEQLGIVTGEELFCHDCEEILEDGRADVAEIFRTCVGLGFSGAEAVGAERWRRSVEAVSRLAPSTRPDEMNAANPAPAPSRSGPVRRTPWLAILFLALAAALAVLTVWQILRAPVDYRERMALLRATASVSPSSVIPPSGSVRAAQ